LAQSQIARDLIQWPTKTIDIVLLSLNQLLLNLGIHNVQFDIQGLDRVQHHVHLHLVDGVDNNNLDISGVDLHLHGAILLDCIILVCVNSIETNCHHLAKNTPLVGKFLHKTRKQK